MLQKQDSFWSGQTRQWRTAAKTQFSALARKAALDGQLTEKGYELVMKGAAPDVPLGKPAALVQMKGEASSDSSSQVHRLDINGYSATDILRFAGQDGRQALYIPGAEQSFYEFDNENKLKDWVIGQARDPVAREELANHFSIYDRSKGNWGFFSETGVDEGLGNLASKTWGAGRIDLRADVIQGDVFSDMAERTRQRNREDLLQISNDNNRRKIWLDDLKKSDSVPFTRPIGRALSAGNFAASVGAQGKQLFATGTASAREDVKEAAGMNVGLMLLFAQSAEYSPSQPAPSQSSTALSPDPAANSGKQTEFSSVEFPPRNATEAINEINERMQAITGKNNLQKYDSLKDLERSSYIKDDKVGFERVRNSLEEVYRRLNSANDRLHSRNAKDNILHYLGKSLNTSNESALAQAYDRMRAMSLEALERYDQYRDYDYKNITFFRRRDKSQPFPEGGDSLTSAFVNLKDRGRIVVNLEGPDEGRHMLSQSGSEKGYNVELVDSIVNQLTRIAGNTQNYIDVKKIETSAGFSLDSAKTALEQFENSRLNDDVLRQVLGKEPDYPDNASALKILGVKDGRPVTEDMAVAAKNKYNSMTEKDRKNIGAGINWTYSDSERQGVSNRIRQDDVLRADLMTSNADTVALYIRDIAARRNYDVPLARAKNPMGAYPGGTANEADLDAMTSLIKKVTPGYGNEKAINNLARKLADSLMDSQHQFEYYKNNKRNAGYAVEDASGTLHIFSTRSEARQFMDRKIQNAPSFWEAVGQKLKNPLGTILSTIADASGASPRVRDQLEEIGNNPFGKSWGFVAKHAGASEDTQSQIEQVGRYAENLIPVWGQARFYQGLAGKALTGEAPTNDEFQTTVGDAKGISSSVNSAPVSSGAKQNSNKAKPVRDDINESKKAIENAAAEDRRAMSIRKDANQARGKPGKAGGRAIKFAPDKGGNYLAPAAKSYAKFDQSVLIKDKPAGVSQGLSMEAMQRMDQGKGNLLSAVKNIKKDLKKSGSGRRELLDRLDGLQKSGNSQEFNKYKIDSSKKYQGDRRASIISMGDDIQKIGVKDVAMLKIGIKDKGGRPVDGGPVLLEQGLKGNQYRLFDPNNGVFTYPTQAAFRAAFNQYMNGAFRDQGELYPEALTTYKYRTESSQGAGRNAKTQAGSSGKAPPDSGSSGLPDTPQAKPQPLFRLPHKLADGRIGYPLGPTESPNLPPAGKWADARPGSTHGTGGTTQAGPSGAGWKSPGSTHAVDTQQSAYPLESGQGTVAGHGATTQAGSSDAGQRRPGSSVVPDAQQPFGNNYDFPYVDAEPVPNLKAVTPSAGSLYERDLQIQRARNLHNIADPKSADYPSYLDQLVSKAKKETGIVASDLRGLQKIAYQNNLVMGIRPVDKFATGLIESGYETKGFHIKGKSASWGPQAGLISADQHFSKLENAAPERIKKFNTEIERSIQGGDAVKVPLELSPDRLDTLARLGTISEMSAPDSNGIRTFTATAPSGKQYRFEATPRRNGGEERFAITSEHKPIEVLAPTAPGAKPLTADYDLLVIGPHMGDLGPQDNMPVGDVAHSVFRNRVNGYKNKDGINSELKDAYHDPKIFYQKEDPDIGNGTERIRNLIPLINNEIMLNAEMPRAKVVHHNADSGSPAADPAANYPATFVLPFKMGRFDEIAIIHNQSEFKDLVQQAKDNGYNMPLNPLWEDEVKEVRRTDFTAAQNKAAGRAGSLR